MFISEDFPKFSELLYAIAEVYISAHVYTAHLQTNNFVHILKQLVSTAKIIYNTRTKNTTNKPTKIKYR